MPVSRKRKKKAQSSRKAPAKQVVYTPSSPPFVDIFSGLSERRRMLAEHRTALAGDAAGAVVDALIAAAPSHSDDDLEDDLCVRYGAAMTQFEGNVVEDLVNPEDLVAALLAAIRHRLSDAEKAGTDPAALRRVLVVVAGVLPPPLSETAAELVATNLDPSSAERATRGRVMTGSALWAHDAYGSRWAVAAPFASVDGRDRWYLWDIDACGYEISTVYSGFHSSAESALAAWQDAVGPAGATAVLTAVDDAETLGALLGGEVMWPRIGGESEAQYAEFLRGRRLGRIVREAVGLGRARGRACVRLTADDAKVQFVQRLRQLGYRDRPADDGSDEGPAGAEELAADLAGFWSPEGVPTLYPSCSPHKVAATVLQVQDFYQAGYAAQLLAALPEWIRFLSEHTGMAAELTERCLAYASGELGFSGARDDEGGSNPMARVIE